MRTGPGGIAFPVPWATDPQMSFLADVAAYRSMLSAAGLTVRHERNRRGFALEFLLAQRAAAEGGPPRSGYRS